MSTILSVSCKTFCDYIVEVIVILIQDWEATSIGEKSISLSDSTLSPSLQSVQGVLVNTRQFLLNVYRDLQIVWPALLMSVHTISVFGSWNHTQLLSFCHYDFPQRSGYNSCTVFYLHLLDEVRLLNLTQTLYIFCMTKLQECIRTGGLSTQAACSILILSCAGITHTMYLNPRWLAGVIVWTGILLCLILLFASKLQAYTDYFRHRATHFVSIGKTLYFAHVHIYSPHSCWLCILPVLVLPGHNCSLQPV